MLHERLLINPVVLFSFYKEKFRYASVFHKINMVIDATGV